MLARSAAYDDAVRYGGTAAYRVYAQRVDVTSGDVVSATEDLLVIGDPSVQVDVTAASRRTLSVTVADPDGTLAPLLQADPLSPFGNELVVSSGFQLATGVELLPQGVFRIVKSASDGRGSVQLETMDRSIVIASARFRVPYVIDGGPSVVDAITDLLLSRYPGLVVQAEADATVVPLTVYQEGSHSGDPWKNAQQLASAAGMELFMGAAGQAVLRHPPDPTTTLPEWQYAPSADSLLLASSAELDAEGVANVAVASGEGSEVGAPLRAEARVTDATSPIHPDTFGERPVFLVSPLITTQQQADDAAAALLLRHAGGTEVAQFTAAWHNAHEGGDVVRLVNPDLGLDAIVQLARFAMPIVPGPAVSYGTTARRAS